MTIKEIAELAGVSIGTIDRVLYHRGRVSAQTKEKVLQIIERYQFTPNPIAKRLQRNKSYKFCTLIPHATQDAGYWGQVLGGITDCAQSLKPLGVDAPVIEYDRYSQDSFKNAIESALTSQPDGILLSPVMPEITKPFLQILEEKKIPYVFFDAEIPGASPLSVIGNDSFKGGYLAGRLMHLFTASEAGGKAILPFAVLNAYNEDYHLRGRRDGFVRYADEHNLSAVKMSYTSEDGINISQKNLTHFLNEAPHISGLFVTNSMAHQVVSAFPQHDFFIIGYDLVPDNHRQLVSGNIDAIISQHPHEQGNQALLTLYHHLVLEQSVPPRQTMALDICLKENIPHCP
ncbi:MAG: substrate-binding domain-containing protein [Treponemataceae bacterium]|nr:MAG: substrate-binding domain-containing protein [Treponemataceae bacterium]